VGSIPTIPIEKALQEIKKRKNEQEQKKTPVENEA
jgi:hypothetical protein